MKTWYQGALQGCPLSACLSYCLPAAVNTVDSQYKNMHQTFSCHWSKIKQIRLNIINLIKKQTELWHRDMVTTFQTKMAQNISSVLCFF